MHRLVVLVLCLNALGSPMEAQFRLPVKLEQLEQRARADSNDPAAHFNAALGYWNAKRWQDADRSLRTAILLDARFAPAYVARMLPQAVESRRNAVNANPENPSLLLDLGKPLAAAGQVSDAAGALRQAMSANPRDPRPPFYLGLVLEQMGQNAEARTAFNQFIALAPSRYDRQITMAKQHLDALR